jgi:sirohydrochlorin cobaltochelatase
MCAAVNSTFDIRHSALILFAHGARDPQWSEPFHALRRMVSSRRPELTVELAFLEIMQPSLEACIAQLASSGHRRVTVAPLFLAQGGHLKQDLPRLLSDLAGRHPAVEIGLLPPIGEVAELLDAIAAWLAASAPR